MDADAWGQVRGAAPLQFGRWLAALLVVIFGLQHGSGTAHYVYVGAIVVLLLLPDAQSIGFGGIKFERLTNEVRRQADEIARLNVSVHLQSSQRTILNFYGVAAGAATRTALAEEGSDEPAEAVYEFIEPPTASA